MNFEKNPRQATRIAREQQALKKKQRRGATLEGNEKSRVNWNIEFENFYERENDLVREARDERAYEEVG